MTNIEKVNKALENAGESEIKKVLDFLGYREDGKFTPKQDEQYWVVDSKGKVDSYSWNNDSYDNYQLSLGNVYRTKEEAIQALDFQVRKANLVKEIEDSSDAIDWRDGNQDKYHFWLDGRNNSLLLSGGIYAQTQGAIYTTDALFLEKLILTRADEVKELLFGVK